MSVTLPDWPRWLFLSVPKPFLVFIEMALGVIAEGQHRKVLAGEDKVGSRGTNDNGEQ